MLISYIFVLFIVINTIFQCLTLPTVSNNNGTTRRLVDEKFKRDVPPKLRVLIHTTRIPITETHYVLHRKLAELLAADEENVEKVVLLTARHDCAEIDEMPTKFGGRLLVVNRMTFGTVATESLEVCQQIVDQLAEEQQKQPKLWEYNGKRFLPNADKPVLGNLEFLKYNQRLLQQLQQFNFNVGIMETNPGEFAFSLLAIFSTIQKFVGTQSTSPTIGHWKYFGYDKIVGAMPGRDLARIGDHKFATESAIKQDPNHFRQINEQLYIKPMESAGYRLQQMYLDAMDENALPKEILSDFVSHANFTEWEMKHRMDLYFTNIQPFLDFPIVEQQIEQFNAPNNQKPVNFIGGITMPRGKVPNLSEDTKAIFESAKAGVVLLSFGSVVEMNDGDPQAVAVKNIIVNVFKQYPALNIVIKWGKRAPIGIGTASDHYKKLSENVYAKGWLEQSAILGNGLKLFITHGGQNSINEAVKFGVPLILFPFFGDQFNNAEALAARGVAKVVDIRSKTLKMALTNALDDIFDNYSEYKQKMEVLSKKMNSIEPAKQFVDKFRQLRKSINET